VQQETTFAVDNVRVQAERHEKFHEILRFGTSSRRGVQDVPDYPDAVLVHALIKNRTDFVDLTLSLGVTDAQSGQRRFLVVLHTA
jgi:hypothetical protein